MSVQVDVDESPDRTKEGMRERGRASRFRRACVLSHSVSCIVPRLERPLVVDLSGSLNERSAGKHSWRTSLASLVQLYCPRYTQADYQYISYSSVRRMPARIWFLGGAGSGSTLKYL